VAIAVGAAVAIGVIAGHSFPDYDATFALVWGRDLAHGNAPDYSLPYRPGGHPLTTALATVLSIFGRTSAVEMLRWIVLLGAGATVAGVFRLGQALSGTAAGVLAAVLLLTRTPVWSFSLLGYMDLVSTALVVWAAVLAVRRPDRGAGVLALLAVAGLVRPEPWLMAGAWWLWLAWKGTLPAALRLLPLAIAGPALWIAWDAVTTQTFLGSVRATAGVPVGPSSGGHGLGDAPRSLARFLGGFLRPPEAIASAAGAALALAAIRTRAGLAIPLGIIAINVIGFGIVAWQGGAQEQRYVFPAAVMLTLFAAHAALGWVGNPSARAWRAAGAVCCAAFAAYAAAVDVDRLRDLRERVIAADVAYSDLRDLVTSDPARCAFAGHVSIPNARLRPFVVYWAGVPLGRVYIDEPQTGQIRAGTALTVDLSSHSLPTFEANTPSTTGAAGTGFPTVAARGGWLLDGRCARQ
jgi:hypothetical protein